MTRILQSSTRHFPPPIPSSRERSNEAHAAAQADNRWHNAWRNEVPAASDLLDRIEGQLHGALPANNGQIGPGHPAVAQRTMLGLVRRCRSELVTVQRAMRNLAANDAMAARNPLFRWRRNSRHEMANCNAARDKAFDAMVLATSRLFHDMGELGAEQTLSIASALREMLATVAIPTNAPATRGHDGIVSDDVLAERIRRLDERLVHIGELTRQLLPTTFASPSIVKGILHPAGVRYIEADIASLLDGRSLRALAQVSTQHAQIARAEQNQRRERLRHADADTLRRLLQSPESARAIFSDEHALANLAQAEYLVSRPSRLGTRLFSSWSTVVDKHPDGWNAGVASLISNRTFMLWLCRSPWFHAIESGFWQSSITISGFEQALRTVFPTLTEGPDALPKDHSAVNCLAALLAAVERSRSRPGGRAQDDTASDNAIAANDASQWVPT